MPHPSLQHPSLQHPSFPQSIFDPSIRETSRAGDRSIVLGALDLRTAIGDELGERPDYVELPAHLARVLNGDFQGLAQVMAERRTRGRRGLAMSLSMDCASGVSPERLARIRREAETALLGDALSAPWPEICEGWPHRDLGEAFRDPVRSDVPVLFISGTLDVRTPPENAEDVLSRFPNGHHLVIDGASHDDDLFLSSSLMLETMREFLSGCTPSRSRIALPPIAFATDG